MRSRCFIAANGPSLNDIDVSKLRGEIVFGLNRGYLKEGLPITYLVVVNDLVEKQFGREILNAPCTRIFANALSGTNVTRLKWTKDIPSFQKKPSLLPMWQGHTVTYVALQLAYEMGFDDVYIVGLDHYFSYASVEEVRKGRGVVSSGKDINHFHPDYFGKGTRWDPANLGASEVAFKLARDTYKSAGRNIYNASSHTNLSNDIFERISFNSIWSTQ